MTTAYTPQQALRTYDCKTPTCPGSSEREYGRGSFCHFCQHELERQGVLRRMLAGQAADLYAQGLIQAQVADVMGISRSYVQSLLHDPEGTRERERKASYAGECVDCGRPTDGSNGRAAAPERCAACVAAKLHEERYWTREQVIAAFQEFAAKHGRAPTVTDASEAHARQSGQEGRTLAHDVTLPNPATVYREIGSWREACRAAGLPPTKPGRPLGSKDKKGRNPGAPSPSKGAAMRKETPQEKHDETPSRNGQLPTQTVGFSVELVEAAQAEHQRLTERRRELQAELDLIDTALDALGGLLFQPEVA